MPYVELKLVGKLTKEQKAKIVEEFEGANWGSAGKLLG
jgi:phenylpyruvate tautomerase PptA (4-oxalocrotonate tautomerase family)